MKKSVTLTIDSMIWEQAKEKLPQSRSEFVEEQLTYQGMLHKQK